MQGKIKKQSSHSIFIFISALLTIHLCTSVCVFASTSRIQHGVKHGPCAPVKDGFHLVELGGSDAQKHSGVCVVTSYYVGGLQFENRLLHKPARPSDYILFWSFLYCHTIRLLPSPCFSSLCSLSAMLLNSSAVCVSNAKQM